MTAGRVQLGAWLLAEDRTTPFDGSQKTPNPLNERTKIRVTLLTSDIRVTKNFGLQISATVPNITRSADVARPTGTLHFSETFRGLGDTTVVGWYRVPNSLGWNITANVGASLPTGKTERPRFRDEATDDGSLVPLSRLQRGTGTVDPMFGISINRSYTRLIPPGSRVFLSAAARLPVVANEHGLRTGASWEVGGGLSREIRWHPLLALARLTWLHREQDVFEGAPVLVGGGDWIMFAPAAVVTVGKMTIQGEIKLPLHRSLSNRQLDSHRSFQIGLIWAF